MAIPDSIANELEIPTVKDDKNMRNAIKNGGPQDADRLHFKFGQYFHETGQYLARIGQYFVGFGQYFGHSGQYRQRTGNLHRFISATKLSSEDFRFSFAARMNKKKNHT